eukprot:CAMPEP_0114244120 /NCGR_PEP_ID=MMETSP0058-20121206/11164_1 /TAXON_ID=36894 /ORGANISM="Pyramimonas parkeae, CCMP726" /LENGTH=372 /DNA_ID=CAMNT_0001357027 /DNA_START=61 /DNA_END=1179 /DNA_ORIENTATION=+
MSLFGSFKIGGALRAKALAQLQMEQKKSKERAAAEHGDVNLEFELPDPRTDWESFQAERQEEATKARTEANARMQARREASMRQTERRRQYASDAERAERAAANGVPPGVPVGGESGPEGGPARGEASPAEQEAEAGVGGYVRLKCHYRGLTNPLIILLTAEEYAGYTVAALKARVSRESGVPAHAGGEAARCTAAGAPTTALADACLVTQCLKEGDHFSIQCQDQGARRARAQSAAVRPTHSRDPAADHERNLWMGHIQCNFPANLTLCSKAQLVKYLQQAGAAVDLTHDCTTLAGQAASQQAAWEARRVVACSSHLEVLRLDKHPTSADIKASFRKLSMAVHPDKNASPSSTEAMRRVTKAYQALMAGAK